MTTVANLDRISVEVTPGEETRCLLEIRNDGSIVESYAVEVVGDAAAWTTVEPSVVSVYPGTSEQVSVYFRPPRSAQVPAGELPYALRVVPTEHPQDLTVPEGTVHVLPFVDTTAEIVPRTSKGRWGAQHEVAIDNRSNTPVQVALTATDPDDRLRFRTQPENLTINPGQAAFVKLRVKPRRMLWRGHPVTLPFQVVVAPNDAPPAALDAATVQPPILPNNLGRLLAALVVLLLLLTGLWFALLRPAVKTAAKEATQEQLAPIAQKANEANEKAQKAVEAAGPGGANGGAGRPTPTAAPSVAPTQQLPGVPAGAQAFARRLQTTTGTNATRSDQYTVPSRRTFVLTDIFLQNPQGDEGRLDLVVDGTVVLTVALNNFRDLDYHMVSPIEVPAGRVISMRVTCQRAGAPLAGTGGSGQCRNFALLSGYHRTVASSPTP
ncbi:COG1470 family protein [Micromonospora sp. NPDC003197]